VNPVFSTAPPERQRDSRKKTANMSEWKELEIDFDWKELSVTQDDWADQAPPAALRAMLQQLYLIRGFEMKLLELKKDNLVHGPVHTSVGQEAVAVGSIAALAPADGICGTHRAHHLFIAKACSCCMSESYDPLEEAIGRDLQHWINTLLAEIMGLSAGCCGGRGGSMHLCAPQIGVLGTNAIVAGGIPLAGGAAFAQRYLNTGNIVVSFFGDGAANQGAFHEALNLAGLWMLPIVYVLENNLYAVATNLAESAPIEQLSLRAASYGMAGRIVDGMDPLAMKIAVAEAAENVRAGQAPYLIEALTYRFFHHAGQVPGSAFGYRTKNEESAWAGRDPPASFAEKLKRVGLLDEAGDAHIRQSVDKAISEAVAFCTAKDQAGAMIINPELIPDVRTVTDGLRSDGAEFEGIEFVEPGELTCEKQVKYVQAIAAVTGRWLEKDPNVFVLGEEVTHMGGGAYHATRGLAERFPGRVLDTPISEAGFTGLAGGAAMSGLRPIVEIMFPDFALVAADQIFNQIAKLRHMYGGRNVDVPLVMRTRVATGCGYGGQHSMDPTALFALFSGWRVLTPTTPADYIGLFNSAMQCKDPVLMIEHHEFYSTTGPVPAENLDYFIPIGKARIVAEGADVTVVSHSWCVSLVARAAEQLADEDISVEAIDLRTVSMPDIDYETIGQSLAKTGALLIVEQAPDSNTIGARIACQCQRRFFDSLDGPIATLTGADVPPPVSRWAESATMPDVEAIKSAIRKLAARQL